VRHHVRHRPEIEHIHRQERKLLDKTQTEGASDEFTHYKTPSHRVDYQQVVERLSKQVRGLAVLVNQADRRSSEREKQLSNHLTRLQTTLKCVPCE